MDFGGTGEQWHLINSGEHGKRCLKIWKRQFLGTRNTGNQDILILGNIERFISMIWFDFCFTVLQHF